MDSENSGLLEARQLQMWDMDASNPPRIALAVIARHLVNPAPILRFLENARSFKHSVERVIVACSHTFSDAAADEIRRKTRLDIVWAAGDDRLRNRLISGGLTDDQVDGLLNVSSWERYRQVPYGAYRNAALLQAILAGVDALLFFDTDVYPKVLTRVDRESAEFRDVDFVGTHMASLLKRRTVATTSDYSGYYIIPPMGFRGLDQLLAGLCKEQLQGYLADCSRHHCLNLGRPVPGSPRPTRKLLGGNLGLNLRQPESLSPFYSTMYVFEGKCVQGRGEDTLLGEAIARSNAQMVDVDLRIFHDTYPDFPRVPDIQQRAVRSRFYRACLGWIGRNPFLTWFLDRSGQLKESFDEAIEIQRQGLAQGGLTAAEALHDPRFARLGPAFEASLDELPVAIQRYKRLIKAWAGFLDAFMDRREYDEEATASYTGTPSTDRSSWRGGVKPSGDSFAAWPP